MLRDEGDVWLLGMFSSHQEDFPDGQSGLFVLDGANLEKGPMATIKLNERISHGLHTAIRENNKVGDSRANI